MHSPIPGRVREGLCVGIARVTDAIRANDVIFYVGGRVGIEAQEVGGAGQRLPLRGGEGGEAGPPVSLRLALLADLGGESGGMSVEGKRRIW